MTADPTRRNFYKADRKCQSCGKAYKYARSANQHFWSCPTPNEDHVHERRLRKMFEKMYWELIVGSLKRLKLMLDGDT